MNDATSTLHVLSLNAGSSSIKCTLYAVDESPSAVLSATIDRIGTGQARLLWRDATGNREELPPLGELDHRAAGTFLLDWLERRVGPRSVAAIGHRIVTGGARYRTAQRVTPELIDELRRISVYAPEHLPPEIDLIELFARRAPDAAQIACFDTAFHRDMPRVAQLFALPRRLREKGVERYGFHGLSYAYLMEELARVAGADAARGRVVLAHLGNGASLAAVHAGKCIDTSMGFTPAAGIPMSTRSGDLDPGLVRYLAHTERMTAERFDAMVNRESGLLGVSETSGDVRDLLACEAHDPRAAEALALFCYRAKKCVGAYAAALGGLDTLVFAGGIGEHAAKIRGRICDGLQFLGLELDAERNAADEPLISAASSRVAVRVIRTDEEIMIAKAVLEVLAAAHTKHATNAIEDPR
ncbi:MAG TPA: acetate/propionate family kinase [Casimicrobiaceae bacterium]